MTEKLTSDKILWDIVDYVFDYKPQNDLAWKTAGYALMDSMGCAVLALNFPSCSKLLGPQVSGMQVQDGVKVMGSNNYLEPIKAAWDIGTLIRWLDYNDTWLAAEWGHPSDNLGAILSISCYLSKKNQRDGKASISMHTVLEAMIKAYEIQGILALDNSFNQVGLDHVLLVRVASAAVSVWLMGGSRQEIFNALTHAWLDGSSLRVYRHEPNAGSRKSWAAGDASSRGLFLAMLAMKGEMGYPTVLSTPKWGFQHVSFNNKEIKLQRPLSSYVMENILFKISYPAEFHAQTAIEAALKLYPQIRGKWDRIKAIKIYTQDSAMRIISKKGKLTNPAARDHCLEYMVAVALLKGDLKAEYYQDDIAKDPMIEVLRKKMIVQENQQYSKDYLDEKKRSIANALKIVFQDGSQTDLVEVAYPVGHKRRRTEGIALLMKKFTNNLNTFYPPSKVGKIKDICQDEKQLLSMPADAFMDLW